MTKKLPATTPNKTLLFSLAALCILQLAAFGLIAVNRHDIKNLKQGSESTQLIYNELDYANQRLSLSVLPKENLLYLPELQLTVPLNQTTRSLRYTFDDRTGDVRIVSSLMTDHATHVQSCGDMVRLQVEPKPDAYSPSQPTHASVALDDGRILQVYASNLQDCASAWLQITPQQIAEQFKAAQSY